MLTEDRERGKKIVCMDQALKRGVYSIRFMTLFYQATHMESNTFPLSSPFSVTPMSLMKVEM